MYACLFLLLYDTMVGTKICLLFQCNVHIYSYLYNEISNFTLYVMSYVYSLTKQVWMSMESCRLMYIS